MTTVDETRTSFGRQNEKTGKNSLMNEQLTSKEVVRTVPAENSIKQTVHKLRTEVSHTVERIRKADARQNNTSFYWLYSTNDKFTAVVY